MGAIEQWDPVMVGWILIGGFVGLLCLAALVSSMFNDSDWRGRWDDEGGDDR